MTETDYSLDLSEVGVPRGEGESWGEAVARRAGYTREWIDCALCGAAYRSRSARLRCCSERFD